ncbi:MAG: metalloregulator ArsR/SmtB family transcription factor [Halieaceae bacterium]
MRISRLPDLVETLSALAEPTRLRILDVLNVGELTVSELCEILGMSQPRISRHLKILTEAELLTRHAEGNWVFYRHANEAQGHDLITSALALYPRDDLHRVRDRQNLQRLQKRSEARAKEYFSKVASSWDSVQKLYVPEKDIETAIRDLLASRRNYRLVDMGTGTGRILEILADVAREGIGVDESNEMLAIARGKLLQKRLGHCRLLKQNLCATTLPDDYAGVVTLHHVLHYLDDPAAAIAEASRLLAPDGILLIVDFAPHQIEEMREKHSHRRLGYEDKEIRNWCEAAGFRRFSAKHLKIPNSPNAQTLTAVVWSAVKEVSRRNKRAAA